MLSLKSWFCSGSNCETCGDYCSIKEQLQTTQSIVYMKLLHNNMSSVRGFFKPAVIQTAAVEPSWH